MSDNLHSKTVMTWVTILISAVGVFALIGGLGLGFWGRANIRDTIGDFRVTATYLEKDLNDIKSKATSIHEDINRKALSANEMYDKLESYFPALLKEHRDKQMEIFSILLDHMIETSPDNDTQNRVEVIRDKAFYTLGEKGEKIRSLQYIGQRGINLDLPFLSQIEEDPRNDLSIKQAATAARKNIESRNTD
ncbi:MAG: nucleotidyltransferase family protein [FCB group bacterium]|nr:nucleotidyltransferase family protein [FCB group bacterium]